ncbi:hypothetical protein QYE76_014690 [Lolium multiflorum]|uniref:Uncharacterized protein n=1 Tax=Lolium multiflorum TaxID=4521 RepID=A0AAD8U5B7_LOLMU|nr:hypothetical protein QYE76_014690 [Lolium multiflorum]
MLNWAKSDKTATHFTAKYNAVEATGYCTGSWFQEASKDIFGERTASSPGTSYSNIRLILCCFLGYIAAKAKFQSQRAKQHRRVCMQAGQKEHSVPTTIGSGALYVCWLCGSNIVAKPLPNLD